MRQPCPPHSKMVLGTSLPEFIPKSAFLLEGNQYSNRYERTITLYLSPDFAHTYPSLLSITDLCLKNPRPAPPDNGAPGERLRLFAHATAGRGKKRPCFNQGIGWPGWIRCGAHCPISASKNHFEGFRYADHTFNLLEYLRRKDNGKLLPMYFSFTPPFFFDSWPISTPGGGMRMEPQSLPCTIITWRWRPIQPTIGSTVGSWAHIITMLLPRG